MNAFTQHVVNDEERRRITSRSFVDVYIPDVDPSQYVMDYSGDYWPYRLISISDVLADEKSVTRTLNRTTKLTVIDDRPPGSNFPGELRDVADRIGADFICPITHTGSSRDAIYAPVERYEYHDSSLNPQFIVPVPHPHTAAIPAINQGLYNQSGSDSLGIRGTDHPTDFMLCDLQLHGFEWETLRESIEQLHENTSGDVNIHLYQPSLTGEMIRYMRANTGAIDSIILSDNSSALLPVTNASDTDTDTDSDITSLFSRSGNRALRSEISPFVRVAAEFSLLCSSFVDPSTDAELRALIEESVIPTGNPGIDPIENAEANQGTLTSLISQ